MAQTKKAKRAAMSHPKHGGAADQYGVGTTADMAGQLARAAQTHAARARHVESGLGAIQRTTRAAAAARERTVMQAHESASQAVCAAEALLRSSAKLEDSVRGHTDDNGAPQVPKRETTTRDQAIQVAQDQAAHASAVAEETVSAIAKQVRTSIAAFDDIEVGDSSAVQAAVRGTTTAVQQSVDVAQEQAKRAIAAAVAGTGRQLPAGADEAAAS